jgi:hypothetical protein
VSTDKFISFAIGETFNNTFEMVAHIGSNSGKNFTYNQTSTGSTGNSDFYKIVENSVNNNKFLLPFCTQHDVFKHIYTVLNFPTGYKTLYTLGSHIYAESSGGLYQGLAMLYK